MAAKKRLPKKDSKAEIARDAKMGIKQMPNESMERKPRKK